MGWTNSHRHEFEVDGVRYGVPDPDWDMAEVADEARVKLFRVAPAGSRFRYSYDFGDGWDHDITVEEVLEPQPGTRYPPCIAGRRACPPEDVGGTWSYNDYLAAIADPSHKDDDRLVEWAGGPFDPEEFDLAATDKWLDGGG